MKKKGEKSLVYKEKRGKRELPPNRYVDSPNQFLSDCLVES